MQVAFNFFIAEFPKFHRYGGDVPSAESAGYADNSDCSVEYNNVAAHGAQLGHRAFVVARFTKCLTIQVGDLVGANDHAIGKRMCNCLRFGMRQALCSGTRGFATQSGFIHFWTCHRKGNAKTLQ